ncbi:MAG: hypothetical protein O3C20_13640 [Verrucomicrobia bacterium]|nr:hypothetical protein [Verrucomicrobiota bacterium]
MRKFFIRLGLFVVLFLATMAALLTTPPVQKAVFLWAATSQLESVSVETVKITSSSFRVEGLSLGHQGIDVSTESAEIKVSWLELVRSRELYIEELVVKGLVADLVTVAGATGGGLGIWLDLFSEEETGPKEPWKGILDLLNPSEKVSVGRVRLDGRVHLANDQSMDLNLTLDDLAVGELARLRIQGAFLDNSETAIVDRGIYDLGIEIDLTGGEQVQSVSGTLGLQMEGSDLNPSGQIDLSGNWQITRTTQGETVSLYIAETEKITPLVDVELNLNVETSEVIGHLSLNVNGSLLPVSLLELPPTIGTALVTTEGNVSWNINAGLGTFDLHGSGVLEQKPWEYELSGNGQLGQIPALSGFVKTGFADEAGPGKLTMNFDVDSAGDGRVVVPVEVERGERLTKMTLVSDVASFSLNPFRMRVDGEDVYMVDLQSVGTALAAWSYSMQKVDSLAEQAFVISESAAPSPIPWNGMTGNATMNLNRLIMPQGVVMENLNAELLVRSDSISMTSFSTGLNQGSIKGKGDLIFTEGLETPFTLRAEGTVINIPSELLDLGSGAPVTGTWNGNILVLGQAQILELLMDSVKVSLDMKGAAGILQLARVNEGANQTAQLLNLGLSLFGGTDGRMGAVSRMTQYLQRVPYDSIRVEVDRFPSGEVAIQDFTIQGPELLLTGKGSIDADSWETLLQGVLTINLAMGTKGNFGENAKVLGLTSQNLMGEYQLWKEPINISGTVDNPDYSALRDMILGAIR